MTARLAGRVCIVTGAGGRRGIGRSIALGYAREGATVVVAGGRDACAVAEEIVAFGGRGLAHPTDVAQPASVEDLFARTLETFGRADVLVNNAGILAGGRLLNLSLTDWERTLAVNLTGVMLCSQRAARAMVAQGKGGRIVYVSSLCPHHGCGSQVAYTAAKAGVEGLTLAAAADLREHGITVNCIAPGNIFTAMTRATPPAGMQPKEWDGRPLLNQGLPQDLVGAALFLASGEASWITGAILMVDGGRHLE